MTITTLQELGAILTVLDRGESPDPTRCRELIREMVADAQSRLAEIQRLRSQLTATQELLSRTTASLSRCP